MKSRIIKLCGKKVGLAYCYATEICFMDFAGIPIDDMDAKNSKHLLYLILSSIFAYYQGKNEEPPVADTDLMYKSDMNELLEAVKVVSELRKEWAKIPEAEAKERSGDDEKNA